MNNQSVRQSIAMVTIMSSACSNEPLEFFSMVGWLVGYGVSRHFQQYSSYIIAVSFIDGGNQSTQRKPLTCRKSLTNFMT
jgi:hypothetical protein